MIKKYWVLLLLASGAFVKPFHINDVNKALITACSKGSLKEVHRALEAGADINCCVEYGTTPLAAALYSQSVEVVDFLIQLGVKVNEQIGLDWPQLGYNALAVAIAQNSLVLVNKLIAAGAQVNSGADLYYGIREVKIELNPPIRNHCLLFFAIYCNASLDIIKALCLAGANKNEENYTVKKWTPLSLAHLLKRDDIVQVLEQFSVKN